VLEGPGGVWCDVDVVEFSHLGSRQILRGAANRPLGLVDLAPRLRPCLATHIVTLQNSTSMSLAQASYPELLGHQVVSKESPSRCSIPNPKPSP
jgi:hypothetical protein